MKYDNSILSEEYVLKDIATYKVPGIGVTMTKDGETILEAGFGVKDLETKAPITADTHWGIASCTKAFTATLLGMLVDQGKLDFDTPIREYIPEFGLMDELAARDCTVRDMMLHRTGLSEHNALWTDTIDRAELFRRLKYLAPAPTSAFRKEKIYNNTVYTALGYIAEYISGMAWDDMIKEWIFKPLGMTDSATTLTDIAGFEDRATPYWNFRGDVRKLDDWSVSPGEPCAGIVSTMKDMTKWAKFHLANGLWEGKQLVSEAVMKDMHAMQIPTQPWAWEWPGLPTEGGYGCAWTGVNYKGHTVRYHLGEIEGYCTTTAFLPDDGITYVTFTNLHKPCVLPMFSSFFTALDNVLGLEKTDWQGEFAARQFVYEGGNEDWDLDQFNGIEPVAGTKPSHEFEAYAGTYYDEGYGPIEIVVDERDGEVVLSGIPYDFASCLTMLYRGERHPLEHFHYDTFRLRDMKQDTLLIGMPVSFLTDPYTGKIDRVEIAIDPGSAPVIFRRK